MISEREGRAVEPQGDEDRGEKRGKEKLEGRRNCHAEVGMTQENKKSAVEGRREGNQN